MPQAGGSFLPNEPASVKGWSVADAYTELTTDGPVPVLSGTYYITKAGVLAMTLRAPTLTESGTVLRFISGTANAHTLTATALINNGTTAGPHNLYTFVAFPGGGITLEAAGGFWNEIGRVLGVVS
jgi:hypothetical protein